MRTVPQKERGLKKKTERAQGRLALPSRLLRRLFMRGFGFRKVFIVTFRIKPHDQSANALIGYWRRANPEYGLNGLVQWPYQNIPPFASKTPGTRGIVVSVKVLFLRGV